MKFPLVDIYLSLDSNAQVQLPPQVNMELFRTLRNMNDIDASMATAQGYLLRSLYQSEFQRFVKNSSSNLPRSDWAS